MYNNMSVEELLSSWGKNSYAFISGCSSANIESFNNIRNALEKKGISNINIESINNNEMSISFKHKGSNSLIKTSLA